MQHVHATFFSCIRQVAKDKISSSALHCSFSTKACGLVIILKVVLAFSKVALAASTTPSLEIPSCS
jgi:hypothetical protein